MATEATVEQDFTALTRMKKGQEPEPHTFKKGDKVSLIRVWEGDLCYIKSAEGKVFNVKKACLNKEAFAAQTDGDKGKKRRKRTGDVPDYAGLSEIRPELDMERGLAPPLSKAVERSLARVTLALLRTKVGATVALVVLVGAVYVGWQNYQKKRNETPYGRLSVVVLQRGALHEPGHFKPSYRAIKLKLNGSEAEAQVRDSLWGKRVLTLKVPGKKPVILASEQENRWLNNRQLRSLYFDEYVDVGSDGRVDKLVRLLEFWSDSKRFVGAYRKTAPVSKSDERRYRDTVKKALAAVTNGG